jgi:hypothetical protein
VTGSAPGERAGAEPSAIARLREVALPLGILLVLGFALRLIIAYGLLPGSGFQVDVASFNGWAAELASHGPWGIYDRPIFLDYTPGYLYILWALGGLAGILGGPGAAPGEFLKFPPMLADLGLAVGAFLLVADLGGRRRAGLVAAALVLFVPVTWIDSAIWSQVDSVGTLVLVFAVWRLGRGDHVGGTLLTTLAAIIKPQFGILIPLAAVLIVRSDFEPRERRWWIDDATAWAIRGLGILFGIVSMIPALGGAGPLLGLGMLVAVVALRLRDRELGFGLGRLVSLGLLGLGTAQAICLPFGISTFQLLRQIVTTGNGYPYVTVNAYNPWAFATRDGNGLLANGTWLPDVTVPGGDSGPGLTILGLPAVAVGSTLLIAAILAIGTLVWRRADRRTLFVALTVMSIAFFVLPTRVHERYMYPFFVLGAALAARSRRWLAVYAALAVAITMNLYGILTSAYLKNTGLDPMLQAFGGLGQTLADAIRSPQGVGLAAVLAAGGLIAAFAFLALPGDESVPDDEEDEMGRRWAESAPRPGERRLVAAASGQAGGAILVPDPGAAGMGAGLGGAVSGAGAWLRRAHFDRTHLLHGEGGGRFDRLDVWLLVVLVVASLTLRTFRLAEPRDMHFDEVYHARTATEFLQDWRYGQPHDIYEWTHPHLAKYAIAGGIVAWGDDRVTASSQVGATVRDAVIEPRWGGTTDTSGAIDEERGQRIYLATGSEVRVYDLVTREQLLTYQVPGASSLALDASGGRLFVGTELGTVLEVSTDVASADLPAAAGSLAPAVAPTEYASLAGPVTHLWAVGDGTTLLATLADGTLASLDATGDTATPIASALMPGVADALSVGTTPTLSATTADVTDPAAEAAAVAKILGGSAGDYEPALRSSAASVTVAAAIGGKRSDLEKGIADGSLAGMEIRDVPQVAVADGGGVAIVDLTTIGEIARVSLDDGATGLADETASPRTIYAASGNRLATIPIPGDASGSWKLGSMVWMPATVSRVAVDPASNLVHALGRTPDGSGWTIYVVEPHANAVFADAALPFQPAAWAMDADPDYPATDRQQVLAFAADGAAVSVDIGEHAFAWRLPGVIAGSIMAGLLFLLTRILFRRRSVGVLVGVFTLLDGMFFVQQRIAMNDSYLDLFLVAGVALFAAIWTGAWKSRFAFWLGMPAVGLLLGLALASKWVALYAIGALGILVLVRSALGRVVVILGLAAGTGVLGWMAIAVPPENAVSGGNLAFVLVMMALTIVAAVVAILHPIAWTPDEVRIAIGGPLAAGAAVGLAAIPLGKASLGMPVAIACFGVAAAAAVGFWLGGQVGLGPMAPPLAEDDPATILPPPADPPDGWLRPGSMLGLPIAWAALSLLVVPVGVYILSYLPWVFTAGGSPQLVAGWPAGHTGQTLLELTQQMYNYHNNLRDAHAASSPWWAWPLDLKPVWFYQGQFANGTSGAIYDGGNVVLWWLSLPAMAFAAFQAFRRRSNALGLVAIVIACLWLAWARIDRATFEYHYYSTLPFVFIALAYFVAEIWHGPSTRTWLLARAGAALALLVPVVLWLGRGPLCGIAGVEIVNPGSQACTSAAQVSITPSAQVLGLVVVLVLGGSLVVWQMLRLDRDIRDGFTAEETRDERRLLVTTAIAAVVALAGAWLILPGDPLFQGATVPGEAMALVLLVVLGPLAWITWTARSPRRFVAGFIAAAAVVFVGFYPNWSALPLPDAVFNYYQGVIPTWLWAFQFSVNKNEPFSVGIARIEPIIIGGVAVVAAAIMAWVAWTWRITLAERAEDAALELPPD